MTMHREYLGHLLMGGCALLVVSGVAVAHNGRGFEIEVVGGKLQAQGINAGAFDGAPAVRPYTNSVHDHWKYISALSASIATLPEFEVLPPVAQSSLESYALDLKLRSAWQWVAPPPMPPAGTIPKLEPLDPGESISIQTLGAPITTDTLGVLELSPSVPAAGTGDVAPLYQISGSPANEVFVLEFLLKATAPSSAYPAIQSSDPVFVILSPDGSNPIEKLHHTSLFLEEYLALDGLPIPEPTSSVMVLVTSSCCLFMRRRKPSND